MLRLTTVVTPARFDRGLSYAAFLAQATVNIDKFEESYRTLPLLPTAVRIAELTGLELRIFLRDENPDIMDEFLSNDGKSRAIPVFVFYTADLGYITHFTERSATAHAGLAAAMDEAKARLGLPANATFGNLPDDDRQKFLREVIAEVQPHLDQWRKDAIKEIRELLSVALGIPNAG